MVIEVPLLTYLDTLRLTSESLAACGSVDEFAYYMSELAARIGQAYLRGDEVRGVREIAGRIEALARRDWTTRDRARWSNAVALLLSAVDRADRRAA